MTGAECHLRINYYLVSILRLRLMKGGPHITLIADDEGFKIFLPLFIPVFRGNFSHAIGIFKFSFKLSQDVFKIRLGKARLIYKSCKTIGHIFKSIETYVCQFSNQQVLLIFFYFLKIES